MWQMWGQRGTPEPEAARIIGSRYLAGNELLIGLLLPNRNTDLRPSQV